MAARFSAETRFKYRVASFVACAICVSLSPFLSFLDARKEKKRRRALRQHALRYVAKNERSSSKVKFIKSTINVRTIYKKKKKKEKFSNALIRVKPSLHLIVIQRYFLLIIHLRDGLTISSQIRIISVTRVIDEHSSSLYIRIVHRIDSRLTFF